MTVTTGLVKRIAFSTGVSSDVVRRVLESAEDGPYPLGTIARWHHANGVGGNMAILGPHGWNLIPNTDFMTESEPLGRVDVSGFSVVYNPDAFDHRNAEVIQ